MVPIFMKGDKALYQQIKAYEMAKTDEQLKSEFGVDNQIMFQLLQKYKLREDQNTQGFEIELSLMIKQDE